MKKIYFLFVFCLFQIGNAQIINFPDANLKTKLLNASPSNYRAKDLNGNYVDIDANNNNEIEVSEAILIYELNLDYQTDYANMFSNIQGLSNFSQLRKLVIKQNTVTTVDLTPFTFLEYFDCSYMFQSMTSLNLNGMIHLKTLDISENYQLTTLNLNDLTALEYFDAANTSIPTLNVIGLQHLQSFDMGQNQLQSLTLQNLPALTVIGLGYSYQLTTVDVSTCTALDEIYLADSPHLVSLFAKNGRNETITIGPYCPALRYLCLDESQLNTVINGTAAATINSYCSFVPGGNFYTIQGSTRYDSNSNGCDSNDAVYPNLRYNIANGAVTGSMIADTSGNYSIPVTTGTHTFAPVIENPAYFNISPSSATAVFPGTTPLVQNFCIAPNGVHNDLEVTLIPVTPAGPGFDAKYAICWKNKGTHSQSGSVSFTYDDAVMDFVSASSVITLGVNSVFWNFTNLLPFESRIMIVTMNLNSPVETPPLNIGNTLNFGAEVNGLADETPIDNSAVLNQPVVNSFDPNDKSCIEGPVVSSAVIGKYVHYLIRFENNGTANARNIVVKDIIDITKFDMASLQTMYGSHLFRTRITNTNQLEFIFENINLPFDDANNDGYVAFKIKTKSTLVVGNTFSNNASIYFDYNLPIVTNTASTTIQALANADFQFDTYFSVAPNPVKNVLNIEGKNNIEISSASVYNTLGQLVLVVAQPNSAIDVSGLQPGNYFIKVTSDKGTGTGKFVKE